MSTQSLITVESDDLSPVIVSTDQWWSNDQALKLATDTTITVFGPSKFQPYRLWMLPYLKASRKDTFDDFPADIDPELSNTRTVRSWQATDLRSRFSAELAEKAQEAQRIRLAYRDRINDLRNDGALDGIILNKDSEKDFWAFVGALPSAEAEMVLVDNGNLRAVWDGEEGSHLGVQFLGGGLLQYVIFRQRKGSRHISRVAGRDTLDGIRKQLEAFELGTLLCA